MNFKENQTYAPKLIQIGSLFLSCSYCIIVLATPILYLNKEANTISYKSHIIFTAYILLHLTLQFSTYYYTKPRIELQIFCTICTLHIYHKIFTYLVISLILLSNKQYVIILALLIIFFCFVNIAQLAFTLRSIWKADIKNLLAFYVAVNLLFNEGIYQKYSIYEKCCVFCVYVPTAALAFYVSSQDQFEAISFALFVVSCVPFLVFAVFEEIYSCQKKTSSFTLILCYFIIYSLFAFFPLFYLAEEVINPISHGIFGIFLLIHSILFYLKWKNGDFDDRDIVIHTLLINIWKRLASYFGICFFVLAIQNENLFLAGFIIGFVILMNTLKIASFFICWFTVIRFGIKEKTLRLRKDKSTSIQYLMGNEDSFEEQIIIFKIEYLVSGIPILIMLLYFQFKGISDNYNNDWIIYVSILLYSLPFVFLFVPSLNKIWNLIHFSFFYFSLYLFLLVCLPYYYLQDIETGINYKAFVMFIIFLILSILIQFKLIFFMEFFDGIRIELISVIVLAFFRKIISFLSICFAFVVLLSNQDYGLPIFIVSNIFVFLLNFDSILFVIIYAFAFPLFIYRSLKNPSLNAEEIEDEFTNDDQLLKFQSRLNEFIIPKPNPLIACYIVSYFFFCIPLGIIGLSCYSNDFEGNSTAWICLALIITVFLPLIILFHTPLVLLVCGMIKELDLRLHFSLFLFLMILSPFIFMFKINTKTEDIPGSSHVMFIILLVVSCSMQILICCCQNRKLFKVGEWLDVFITHSLNKILIYLSTWILKVALDHEEYTIFGISAGCIVLLAISYVIASLYSCCICKEKSYLNLMLGLYFKANDFKLNKNVDHFDLSAIVSFLVAFGFALFVMDIVLLVRIQSNYSLFIPYFVIWPIAMVYAIYFAYRYPELFEFEKKKKKKNTEAEAVQPPNIN